jgi:hypothetical protein
MPKRSKPRALDIGVIAAINAAAPKLASTDPAVYVAFLMFSRLGLRNVEIRNARWGWIENGRIGIIDRPNENFYPKGSEGWVPIPANVLKELMRFRHLSTDDYIVPGATMTERKIAVDRRHSAWVGRWIRDRAKTSYELRPYAGSLVYYATRDILKVRDFLRHASVETTQQRYAYLLEDVPSIGMKDFAPATITILSSRTSGRTLRLTRISGACIKPFWRVVPTIAQRMRSSTNAAYRIVPHKLLPNEERAPYVAPPQTRRCNRSAGRSSRVGDELKLPEQPRDNIERILIRLWTLAGARASYIKVMNRVIADEHD